MPSRAYLFTARTRAGREVTDRVIADSAAAALKAIEARDLVEINLLDDDTFPREVTDSGRSLQTTLPVALDSRLRTAGPARQFILQISSVYRQCAFVLGILIAFFAYRRALGVPLAWFDYFSIAFALFPIPLVAFLSRGLGIHRQAQLLAIEGKFDELELILPSLEKTLRKIGARGELEAAVWRARLMVERNDVAGALHLLVEFQERTDITKHEALIALARVHSSIPDHDAALRCCLEVTRVAPEIPSGWMAAAETYALQKRMPNEAREALNRAKTLPLNQMNRVFVRLMEGTIDVLDGRANEAKSRIEGALPELELLVRANPIGIGTIRSYEAVLAEAYALLGDWQRARAIRQRCELFLKLHRQGHLLAGYDALVRAGQSDGSLRG